MDLVYQYNKNNTKREGVVFQKDRDKEQIASFQLWLKLMGYSKATTFQLPLHVEELSEWLQTKGYTLIYAFRNPHIIRLYHRHIKRRKNKRTGIGLSVSYINKHSYALTKFSAYLHEHGKLEAQLHLGLEKPPQGIREVLTPKEVKALFEACDNDTVGLRDKALLSLLYGCGLRRSEALNLCREDIDFDKEKLFIKKSKNGSSRTVPFNGDTTKHLYNYSIVVRPYLLNEEDTSTFLRSLRGGPLHGETAIYRVRLLAKRAGITKRATLHGLRHSIATHLLAAGLSIEDVALFLGHKSLDSTQLYTHINSI